LRFGLIGLLNTDRAGIGFVKLKVTIFFTVVLSTGVEGQFDGGHVGYARKSDE
jgi:hypothetical protein